MHWGATNWSQPPSRWDYTEFKPWRVSQYRASARGHAIYLSIPPPISYKNGQAHSHILQAPTFGEYVFNGPSVCTSLSLFSDSKRSRTTRRGSRPILAVPVRLASKSSLCLKCLYYFMVHYERNHYVYQATIGLYKISNYLLFALEYIVYLMNVTCLCRERFSCNKTNPTIYTHFCLYSIFWSQFPGLVEVQSFHCQQNVICKQIGNSLMNK